MAHRPLSHWHFHSLAAFLWSLVLFNWSKPMKSKQFFHCKNEDRTWVTQGRAWHADHWATGVTSCCPFYFFLHLIVSNSSRFWLSLTWYFWPFESVKPYYSRMWVWSTNVFGESRELQTEALLIDSESETHDVWRVLQLIIFMLNHVQWNQTRKERFDSVECNQTPSCGPFLYLTRCYFLGHQ